MTPLQSAVLILSFSYLSIHARGKDISTSPAPYVTPALDTIKRVNKVYTINSWPTLPDAPQTPLAFLKYDIYRKNNTVAFGRFAIPIKLEFLASTQIIGFSRQNTFQGAPLYEELPKAEWTQAHTVEVAEALLVALVGERPSDLGATQTHFYYPVRPSKKFYDGEWMIMWPRVSKDGHAYQNDCIRMMVREKLGLIGFKDNRVSHYQENTPIKITEEKARELAPRLFDELKAWPFAQQWLHDFTLGETKAEMFIVNPNHITSQPGVDALAFARDPQARLAWIMTRRTTYTGDRTGKDGIPVGGEVQVWIDVETGEFLGGDLR